VLALGSLAFVAASSAHPARGARRLTAHPAPAPSTARRKGIHKIRHIVIIMQENRSFDNYFGTYPKADGIPGLAGHPGSVPCLPTRHGTCVKPFHDRHDINMGGPYGFAEGRADIDGGKMDGFVKQQETACRCASHDVVGYHTAAEIPNYWKYAHHFVLQDHLFQSVRSWSLPSHLYLTSLWSAYCTKHNDPASCTNTPQSPAEPSGFGSPPPIYAWTDLTYLLHKHHVSWRYYLFNGSEPLCESNASKPCTPTRNGPTSLTIWYPLKWFDTVRNDGQRNDVESVKNLFAAARRGRLPAVSWVVPSEPVSEHTTFATVSKGQTYVTGLVNALMRSADWKSTAIFITWDDWGGLYDNAVPPRVDHNGYGLRVPGLVISPYARRGYIDHQVLSFDAYAKFIEDDFLGGARLNPRTDGRPDPRLDVRENEPELGNLVRDFNFNQAPRKPLRLPVHPKTDLIGPSSPELWRTSPALGWG
jgi:phospholipase C